VVGAPLTSPAASQRDHGPAYLPTCLPPAGSGGGDPASSMGLSVNTSAAALGGLHMTRRRQASVLAIEPCSVFKISVPAVGQPSVKGYSYHQHVALHIRGINPWMRRHGSVAESQWQQEAQTHGQRYVLNSQGNQCSSLAMRAGVQYRSVLLEARRQELQAKLRFLQGVTPCRGLKHQVGV
jgi:hypothetical protein